MRLKTILTSLLLGLTLLTACESLDPGLEAETEAEAAAELGDVPVAASESAVEASTHQTFQCGRETCVKYRQICCQRHCLTLRQPTRYGEIVSNRCPHTGTPPGLEE